MCATHSEVIGSVSVNINNKFYIWLFFSLMCSFFWRVFNAISFVDFYSNKARFSVRPVFNVRHTCAKDLSTLKLYLFKMRPIVS